jgi:hypothetical protein
MGLDEAMERYKLNMNEFTVIVLLFIVVIESLKMFIGDVIHITFSKKFDTTIAL